MKERVLIFSLAYYPRFVGGAEVAIKEITDRNPDIEFDMVTLRFDSSLPRVERIGNVTVHRVGFSKKNPSDADLLRFPLYLAKIFYPVQAYLTARALDKTRKYGAIWCMMSYMGFPALFLNAFRRKSRTIPFILTLQEGDPLEHVSKRWRIRAVSILYRRIFKRAKLVQPISHYLSDFARAMGYEGKIEMIPNGVDSALFSQRLTDTDTFELKTALGKKYTDTFLVTTSRLVPKNGIGDIIQSLTFLQIEIKLLVIGSGPLDAELKAQVAELGLQERVQFLGYIPHADLWKYLRVSDIFVRPSLSEGFGSSFIEAMVAELPVVATHVGGIADFLEDKSTGMVCHANDPRSIARAVEKILANKAFRDTLVLNAKKMAAERYEWSLIAREMRERAFDPLLIR